VKPRDTMGRHSPLVITELALSRRSGLWCCNACRTVIHLPPRISRICDLCSGERPRAPLAREGLEETLALLRRSQTLGTVVLVTWLLLVCCGISFLYAICICICIDISTDMFPWLLILVLKNLCLSNLPILLD